MNNEKLIWCQLLDILSRIIDLQKTWIHQNQMSPKSNEPSAYFVRTATMLWILIFFHFRNDVSRKKRRKNKLNVCLSTRTVQQPFRLNMEQVTYSQAASVRWRFQRQTNKKNNNNEVTHRVRAASVIYDCHSGNDKVNARIERRGEEKKKINNKLNANVNIVYLINKQFNTSGSRN